MLAMIYFHKHTINEQFILIRERAMEKKREPKQSKINLMRLNTLNDHFGKLLLISGKAIRQELGGIREGAGGTLMRKTLD